MAEVTFLSLWEEFCRGLQEVIINHIQVHLKTGQLQIYSWGTETFEKIFTFANAGNLQRQIR